MKVILTKSRIFGRLSKESALLNILGFWSRFLVIVAPLLFSPAFLQASDNEVLTALELLPERPQQSREILEKLPATHPQFQIAVEELMKLYYRSQEWEKFFSYAQYYRHRWSASKRRETQLLEALALLRHCQNDALTALLTELDRELKLRPPELDQIDALSKTQFRAKATESKPPSRLSEHSKGTSLWKSNQEMLGKVHPSKIQIRVENQCES